ncbi:ankyrin repeat and LEM domain-containing protein 1 [Cinclus cinclus]|uniref:ankyrin repeat and LEM domain-containing protein 1 n=1 Tax=Cinclus cinclus TaxID=127875 RepID=UPI002E161C67
MSPRPPGVAVTSPPGRCVPAGDRDVSGGDGEGTGGSWGDTQTVHGLSPGGGSAPKSGTGVLRGLGDKGHTQNSLSLARDSPRSSPWLWPVPGKRQHPQKSPPVTRGPPSATSSPRTEGGTGWQRHSPLGTSRSQRVLRHLLVPRPPGSASGELGTPSVPLSPNGELGTPSVPLSPGCATPHSESHQEDVTQDQAPCECHSPGGSPGRGTDATSSAGGGTGSGGRVSLWQPDLGDNPGAVTELPRLEGLARGQRGWPKGHSPELVAALRTGHIPDCAQDELALSRHFKQPQRGRAGREGQLKCSFNYLLLDPRVTQDLPRRSPSLSPAQLFQDFVTAVFYVGKGTRARPWWHLRQARAQHQRGTHRGCPKVRRILEIWDSGQGVVPLQCFQHRVPAEAFTRESCMLEALGLQSLTNARQGPCYGVAVAWPAERRRRLGVSLLHRAMNVLLAQGECQLRPGDIPG